MAYGVIITIPAPLDLYTASHDEIVREQGPAPVPGLVVHYARAVSGGFQVLEVWDTKEDCDRFTERVVLPVMQRLAAGQPLPPQQREEFEAVGVLTASGAVPAPRAGGVEQAGR